MRASAATRGAAYQNFPSSPGVGLQSRDQDRHPDSMAGLHSRRWPVLRRHEDEFRMGWSLPIGVVKGTVIRVHITFLLFLAWIGVAAFARGGQGAALQSEPLRLFRRLIGLGQSASAAIMPR